MLRKSTIALSLLIFSGIYAAEVGTKPAADLLILDTEGKDAHQYRNLMLMAQAAGFTPHYQSLYDVLDNGIPEHYQSAFILFSNTFVQNMNSLVAKLYLGHIQNFVRQKNKNIGIFLPSPIGNFPIVDICWSLARALGADNDDVASNLHALYYGSGKELQRDSMIGRYFGTRLLNKTVATMPDAPLSFYAFNTDSNNHYMFARNKRFTFSEIDEYFYINPLNPHDRAVLLAQAQHALWKFARKCNVSQTILAPALPEQVQPTFALHEKERFTKARGDQEKAFRFLQKSGIHVESAAAAPAPAKAVLPRKFSLGWFDPGDFFAPKVPGALIKGVKFIDDAGLSALWFEFNPEEFLSPHGRKMDYKDQFIQQVTDIASALKKQFSDRPMPKIFVGTDITVNFSKHPVANPVITVFGTKLDKIPAPLDVDDLWKPELLDIFDQFIKLFANILPIDGYFLDFEMYQAQTQAGTYSDIMDFSRNSWNVFRKKTHAPDLAQVEDRIAYLIKKKQFKAYIAALEEAAQDLGRMIKEHMRKHIPNLVLGVYAPTLPESWFYRGIYAGLSSPDSPLVTATFNNDYYSHAQWLANQNIYLLHGSVVMLSKLAHADSFGLIDQTYTDHDFVWYNRASRVIWGHDKNKWNELYGSDAWWAVEASEIPADDLAAGIAQHSKGQ